MRTHWPRIARGNGNIALIAVCLLGNLSPGCARNAPRPLSAIKRENFQDAVVQTEQPRSEAAAPRQSTGPEFVDLDERKEARREQLDLHTLLSNAQPDLILERERNNQPIITPSQATASTPAGYAIIRATQQGPQITAQHPTPTSPVVQDGEHFDPKVQLTSSETELSDASRPFPDVEKVLAIGAGQESDKVATMPVIAVHPKTRVSQTAKNSSRQTLVISEAPHPPESESKGHIVFREPDDSAPDQKSQARMEMERLVAMAIAEDARGELHAAYRSALLAKQIADAEQLSVDRLAASPTALAETISKKIWHSSDTVIESGQDEQKLPTIHARRIPEHDAVFKITDSNTLWEPMSLDDTQPAWILETRSADEVDSDRALHSEIDESIQDSDTTRSSRPPVEIERAAGVAPAPREEIQLTSGRTLNSNRQADAQLESIKRQESTQTDAHFDVPVSGPKEYDPHNISTADLPAGMDASHSAASNWRWGVLAFITATILTLIGFRLNEDGLNWKRRRDAQPHAKDADLSEHRDHLAA